MKKKIEFLTFCKKIIPFCYDGNPLKLQEFLNSINLIKQVTHPKLNETFIQFIKSKLNGIATVSANATSVGEIINELKCNCGQSNSDLIIGRMQMLRIIGNNFVDFSNNLEILAKQLIESLIILGCPRHVATKIAIEHTVNICRERSNFNQVKIILASCTFKTIEDVIAKFLQETAIDQREQKTIFKKNYNSYRKSDWYFENNFYNNNNINKEIENNSEITDNIIENCKLEKLNKKCIEKLKIENGQNIANEFNNIKSIEIMKSKNRIENDKSITYFNEFDNNDDKITENIEEIEMKIEEEQNIDNNFDDNEKENKNIADKFVSNRKWNKNNKKCNKNIKKKSDDIELNQMIDKRNETRKTGINFCENVMKTILIIMQSIFANSTLLFNTNIKIKFEMKNEAFSKNEFYAEKELEKNSHTFLFLSFGKFLIDFVKMYELKIPWSIN